jgi:hypothetical protein
MSYNGWGNYETWNVKLWLDNEPGTYHEVTDEAERIAGGDGSDGELAGWLESYVRGMMPDLGASMFSDLLGAALSEVDWAEIAEAYMDDARGYRAGEE